MKDKNKTFVFLCDVNNVLLMIASQLYKKGINVKYVPDLRLNQHFRIWDAPIDPLYAPEKFCDFSISENIDKGLIYSKSAKEVKSLLLSVIENDSIVIGSDYAPAIFEYAGLKLDYFAVTGADVNSHTLISKFTKISDIKQAFFQRNKEHGIVNRIRKSLESTDIPSLQRKGIARSKALINSDHFNWQPLKDVKYIVIPYPLPGAVSEIESSNIVSENFPLKSYLDGIRENTDLLVVNISKNDFWKGTHTFFEGFKMFRDQTKLTCKLLIFGRGNLAAIKRKYKYVDEMITKGEVIVLPPVCQRDVEVIIDYCDVCFGGICTSNYVYDWNTSIMQYAKLGKPLITYSPFGKHFSGFEDIVIYPHLTAQEPSEVCESLIRLESSKVRNEYVTSMKEWNQYFVNTSITKWMEVLNN